MNSSAVQARMDGRKADVFLAEIQGGRASSETNPKDQSRLTRGARGSGESKAFKSN